MPFLIFLKRMQHFQASSRIPIRKGETVVLSKSGFTAIYNRQADTVYRVCYSFMKNPSDTEDMVQETFLRLLSARKQFENERHERAWLIITASNLCKDNLKRFWCREENIDDFLDVAQEPKQEDGVLEAITQLPDEYKDAVYLYYYEGYSTAEIADLKGCPEATVRSRLMRARKRLAALLGGVAK